MAAFFFFKLMCFFPNTFQFSEITGFMLLCSSFQNSVICFISGCTQDHREICHIYRIHKQFQDSFPLLSRKSKCPRKIQQEQYSLIFVSLYRRRVTWLMCSMQLPLNNFKIHQTDILSFSEVVC